jgi:hypothetical protein
VEHLKARVREQNRLAAEIGWLVTEIEARGAQATFGYGSTLALLEDVTHLSRAAAKKVLDRARAVNPSRQIDGTQVRADSARTDIAHVAR